MNNEHKASLYNQIVSEHTRISNQISSIKGESIEISQKNLMLIDELQKRQVVLSKKLDDLLKEAKIDGELIASLGESIKGFEGAAKNMSSTVDSIEASKKYGEELSLAAAQMESLNSLYKVQVESTSRQTEVNERVAENAEQLKAQMEHLATSLSSLNGVYGGMLSAMSRN